jgi:hypothetical protein
MPSPPDNNSSPPASLFDSCIACFSADVVCPACRLRAPALNPTEFPVIILIAPEENSEFKFNAEPEESIRLPLDAFELDDVDNVTAPLDPSALEPPDTVTEPPDASLKELLPTNVAEPSNNDSDPPDDTPLPPLASIVTLPPAPVEPKPLRTCTDPPTMPSPPDSNSSPPTTADAPSTPDFARITESPAFKDRAEPANESLAPTDTVTAPAEPGPVIAPLPNNTDPLDTPNDDPVEISTEPLPELDNNEDDVVNDAPDTPDRDREPPAPLPDVCEPAAADSKIDPPTDPEPAVTDTVPPRASAESLDPAFTSTSPDEPRPPA